MGGFNKKASRGSETAISWLEYMNWFKVTCLAVGMLVTLCVGTWAMLEWQAEKAWQEARENEMSTVRPDEPSSQGSISIRKDNPYYDCFDPVEEYILPNSDSY